jgi:hypothetical protein
MPVLAAESINELARCKSCANHVDLSAKLRFAFAGGVKEGAAFVSRQVGCLCEQRMSCHEKSRSSRRRQRSFSVEGW